MPAKKQTKKLTPSKLVKTNGKFDWRKLSLIAIIFIAAGTIIAFTTFASSFTTISPTQQGSNDYYVTWYGSLDANKTHWTFANKPGAYYNQFRKMTALGVSNTSGQTVEFCVDIKNTQLNYYMLFKMDVVDVNTGKYFVMPVDKSSANTYSTACVHGTVPRGIYGSFEARVFDVHDTGGGGGGGLDVKQGTIHFY